VRLGGGPGAVVGARRQRPLDAVRAHDLAHLGRLLGGEATHVPRDAPELLVRDQSALDRVGERRHRRAVEPRAKTHVDVAHRRSAGEEPALRQVGRADRVIPVVGQRRRRVAIAAPGIAVALEALELLVDLTSLLTAAAGLAGDLDRRWPVALEEAGEALEVLDHLIALALRDLPLPSRHRRAGHAVVDDAAEVVARGDLTARRGADLVDGLREVARPRQHVGGRGAVAGTGQAMTLGAPAIVGRLAGRALRGEGRGKWEEGRDDSRRGEDEKARASHGHLPSPAARLPDATSAACAPTAGRGR
jgi:hypothetical protein